MGEAIHKMSTNMMMRCIWLSSCRVPCCLCLPFFFVSLRVLCCDVLAVFRCGFVSCVVSLYSCRVCVSFVLCLIALRAVSACCWAIRYWSCRVSCR